MKKTVLILLLLFVVQTIYAQNVLPGSFFGSTFGTTLRTVRFNLEKEGFRYDEEVAEGAIAVSNVPYESLEFNSVVFLFNFDKFYLVNFFMNFDEKEEALSTYKYMQNRLKEKYGKLQKNEEANAITYHHLNRSVQLQWYVQPFIDGAPRYYLSLAYYDESLLPPGDLF